MQSTGTAPAAAIGTPAFYRDPYPTYRALLDSGTRAVRLAPNYVAVTHYRDCLAVLRDPRLSAVRTKNRLAHLTDEERRMAISLADTLEAMMLFTDPPQACHFKRTCPVSPHIDHCGLPASSLALIWQEPCTQNLSTGNNNSAAHQEKESTAAAKNKPVDFRCRRPTQTP